MSLMLIVGVYISRQNRLPVKADYGGLSLPLRKNLVTIQLGGGGWTPVTPAPYQKTERKRLVGWSPRGLQPTPVKGRNSRIPTLQPFVVGRYHSLFDPTALLAISAARNRSCRLRPPSPPDPDNCTYEASSATATSTSW
jgi:hypothetical protein